MCRSTLSSVRRDNSSVNAAECPSQRTTPSAASRMAPSTRVTASGVIQMGSSHIPPRIYSSTSSSAICLTRTIRPMRPEGHGTIPTFPSLITGRTREVSNNYTPQRSASSAFLFVGNCRDFVGEFDKDSSYTGIVSHR